MEVEWDNNTQLVCKIIQDSKVIGYMVIDSLVGGCSYGGIRMMSDIEEKEICELVHAITLKYGFLRLPKGGAKVVRPVRGNVLFTFILLCFVFVILLKTMELGRVAGLMPNKVVLLTLLLLLAQLLSDIFLVNKKNMRIFNNNAPMRKGILHSEKDCQSDSEREPTTNSNREKVAFLWILVIPVSVYIFGIIPSAVLYTFSYARLKGRSEWLTSMVIAGTLSAFLYVLFSHVLNFSLYRGQLLIWLGI